MTSLLTNVAALSSLRALGATQSQLSRTQAQISSGLAIATASDGAAYWSIAQTMSAQVVGLRAVDQGLSMTMSIADVTATALGSIKGSLDRIQADVVAAQQAGVSLSAIQSDISAQQQSIIAVANSASFNGVNWLINLSGVSQKVTINHDIHATEQDDDEIAGNQISGFSVDNYSISTTSIMKNQMGNTTTQIESLIGTISIDTTGDTFDQDGRATSGYPIVRRTVASDTLSGSLGIVVPAALVLPVSQSSTDGVVTSSFALSPLELFSENTGTTITDTTYQYTDKRVIKPETVTTSTGYSYDAAASSEGILDRNIPISGQAGQTILNLDVTRASTADFAVIGQAVQTAISGIMNASTTIGSLQTQISNQRTFNSALADSLTSGVGSLVDADMNVASIRLQALQTQQQLGIQALSIANQDGQLLLKLFEAA